MASPKKPWPAWATGDYINLRRQAGRVKTMAEKARETRHRNIYLTIELLSRVNQAGQDIANICKELDLRRGGERWPYWVNRAVQKSKKGGLYIAAGARHALEGIEKDNWKMVGLGISTCLDRAGQVETALLDGPPPAYAAAAAQEIVEQAFEQE